MDCFIPGRIININALKAGDLMLAEVDGTFHAGVIIEISGSKSVLDFHNKEENRAEHFRIVPPNYFDGGRVMHIPKARVSPSIIRTDLSLGRPNNYANSEVIYLTSDGPVVYAQLKHSSRTINIAIGQLFDVDTALEIHSRRWAIEYLGADGEYKALCEFKG